MSEIATVKPKFDIGQLESIFIKGDISSMNEVQRIEYTRELCRSLGLNPMTQPFDYINFQGKLTLYAKKGCTDQLRGIYGISVKVLSQTIEDGILTVTAQASFPDGRTDEDIGCVSVGNLKGDALANARMKAVTKAKRRVTLSICGLGMLDESEVETMKGATPPTIEKDVPSISIVDRSKPSQAQLKRLFDLSKESHVELDQVKEYIQKEFKKDSTKDLTMREYDQLCNELTAGFLDVIKPEAWLKEGETI